MPSEYQPALFDLTSSAAASPAKTFRWLEGVLGWLDTAAASGSCSAASLALCVPAGFASRTSLDCCQATAEGTWEPSSGRWRGWGMGGPTACLTLNGSECPKDAAVCSLSDVLETGDVPPEFFLSPKACRGILRRAAKRGRELPPALREALTAVAEVDMPAEGKRTT